MSRNATRMRSVIHAWYTSTRISTMNIIGISMRMVGRVRNRTHMSTCTSRSSTPIRTTRTCITGISIHRLSPRTIDRSIFDIACIYMYCLLRGHDHETAVASLLLRDAAPSRAVRDHALRNRARRQRPAPHAVHGSAGAERSPESVHDGACRCDRHRPDDCDANLGSDQEKPPGGECAGQRSPRAALGIDPPA